MNVRFEWDDRKGALNLRKHGVSFELARRVFTDPLTVVEPDPFAEGERRWRAIGMAGGFAVLVVVHTVRGDQDQEIIRIISARPADRHERRRYEYDPH